MTLGTLWLHEFLRERGMTSVEAAALKPFQALVDARLRRYSRNLLRCHGTMLCSASRHMLMTSVNTRPLIHCQLQHRENRGPVVHKANCLILPIEKKLYCKHTVSSINTSEPTYNILQTAQLAFSFGTTERRTAKSRISPWFGEAHT